MKFTVERKYPDGGVFKNEFETEASAGKMVSVALKHNSRVHIAVAAQAAPDPPQKENESWIHRDRNELFFELLSKARVAQDWCVNAIENYPDELPEAQESRETANDQLAKFLIAHTNTINISFGDAPPVPDARRVLEDK